MNALLKPFIATQHININTYSKFVFVLDFQYLLFEFQDQ